MRTRARFKKEGEMTLIDGVPIEEVGMELEVGVCVECGATAEQAGGGALENVRVEAGVIRGDAICPDCLLLRDDTPAEMLDFINGRDGDAE